VLGSEVLCRAAGLSKMPLFGERLTWSERERPWVIKGAAEVKRRKEGINDKEL